MLHKREQTYVNVRVDDVGSADGTSNLEKRRQRSMCRSVTQKWSASTSRIPLSWWLSRTHRVGGAVSVCSSVTEENAHFVHRHRLDLLPSAHADQQLVELQLVSVPAEDEEQLTLCS